MFLIKYSKIGQIHFLCLQLEVKSLQARIMQIGSQLKTKKKNLKKSKY